MKHQPFESWIIDETKLSSAQFQELQAHLEECPECRKLQQGWQTARQCVQNGRMVSPAPGFSQRWQDSLAERRARQQRLQMRRFFLLLSSATFTLLLALIALALFSRSPIEWLIVAATHVTRLVVTLSQIQENFLFVLRLLPPAIPLAFWIILTGSLSLLSLAWVFMMWRISTQGAYQK